MKTNSSKQKGQALCLALLYAGLSSSCLATVHYVDKGTRYHLGDDRLATTRDKGVVATHPNIGTVWEQDFTASRDYKVEVLIEKLWGVDAADGRQVHILIDGEQVGELTAGEEGPYRALLKHPVRKGKLHTLRIHTFGKPDPDDFVFEGVQVRTYTHARIRPEGDARVFTPLSEQGRNKEKKILRETNARQKSKASISPTPETGAVLLKGKPGKHIIGNCGVYNTKDPHHRGWRPNNPGKGDVLLSVGQDRVVTSDVLANLPRGYIFTFYFKIRDLPHGVAGQHLMEFMVNDGRRGGWNFEILAKDAVRAKNGAHSLRALHQLDAVNEEGLLLLPGWNKVELVYCTDEGVYLEVNDRVLGKRLNLGKKVARLKARVLGIELELAEKPGPRS